MTRDRISQLRDLQLRDLKQWIQDSMTEAERALPDLLDLPGPAMARELARRPDLRPGVLQFLLPLPQGALVLGKAVGCGLVYGATLLLALICAVGIAPGGSPLDWATVLLGSGATYALLAPAAALLSAWLPVASDLGKTGSGGNPHGLAMAAGTLLVLLAAGPPAAILLVVHRGLERPLLGLALMVAWTGLAVALAIPLLRLAARAIGPRRENLALVAGSR